MELIIVQYNHRDHNILGGGLIDGRVGIWDQRIGGDPKATCAPHVAHRDLVRNVIFINSKSGQEFFSGSVDGSVKWWDARNMSECMDEVGLFLYYLLCSGILLNIFKAISYLFNVNSKCF